MYPIFFLFVIDFFFVTDIEKRKSFADMKLAEVAAGGQQWNFENLPEEPSTPCDVAIDEAVDEDFMTKNGDSYDDGHHDQAEEEDDCGVLAEDDDDSNLQKQQHCNGHEAAENGDKNETGVAMAEAVANSNGQTPPLASGDDGILPATPTAAAALALSEKKLDPVTEICADLQVKIADLGNACWVVSVYMCSLVRARVSDIVFTSSSVGWGISFG